MATDSSRSMEVVEIRHWKNQRVTVTSLSDEIKIVFNAWTKVNLQLLWSCTWIDSTRDVH